MHRTDFFLYNRNIPTAKMVGRLDADAGWMPLYLSMIAGMSTCLGALIVFCHPIEDEGDGNAPDGRRRFSGRRKVSPATMAFSLALAGSVMVTVSVVSIGPECLAASSMKPDDHSQEEEVDEESGSFFVFGITFMPIWSWAFLQRLVSFSVGALIYFVLSKYAFPEPEEIISNHSDTLLAIGGGSSNGASDTRQKLSTSPSKSWSLAGSVKTSDDEDEDADGENGGAMEVVGLLDADENPTSSPGAESLPTVRKRASGEGSTGKTNATSTRNKGVVRRPPTERNYMSRLCCCCGLSSTSLRVFTSGSDLETSESRRAWRVAMLLFVSLLMHNFPEGLAVAASALESDQLGLTVTVGVMIHNIPEGIAIAIPCLAARPDSPWLSFLLASASGLAEPAGAFVAMVFLREVEDHEDQGGMSMVLGKVFELENVLAFVAGIMITVSLLELFPEARRHAEKSANMKPYYSGTLIGIVVMLLTEFGMSL